MLLRVSDNIKLKEFEEFGFVKMEWATKDKTNFFYYHPDSHYIIRSNGVINNTGSITCDDLDLLAILLEKKLVIKECRSREAYI